MTQNSAWLSHSPKNRMWRPLVHRVELRYNPKKQRRPRARFRCIPILPSRCSSRRKTRLERRQQRAWRDWPQTAGCGSRQPNERFAPQGFAASISVQRPRHAARAQSPPMIKFPLQIDIFVRKDGQLQRVEKLSLPKPGPYPIGRLSENPIRLDDRQVSREHAILEVGEEGIEV